MHELSYVTELISSLKGISKDNKFKQIKIVTLEISALSGIEPKSFRYYWREITKKTKYKNTKLIFKCTPSKIKCFSCQKEFMLKKTIDSLIVCKYCGSIKTMIVEDTTVTIKSVTLN